MKRPIRYLVYNDTDDITDNDHNNEVRWAIEAFPGRAIHPDSGLKFTS